MYELDIYHTDLKPANIVCMKETDQRKMTYYTLKLIDFGTSAMDFREVKAITRQYFIPFDEEVIIQLTIIILIYIYLS